MANKTIHELNQATTVTGSHEFAVYDTSNNSTQRASLAQIFDNNEILWADNEDEPISTDPVDFESADELNPTDTENVTLLESSDSWSQRFQKISQMFKNIRFILGKLGTTDISSIGNGTVTGALSELNSNLDNLYVVKTGKCTKSVGAGATIAYTLNDFSITIPEGYTTFNLIFFNTTSVNVVLRGFNVGVSNTTTNMLWVYNTSTSSTSPLATLTIAFIKSNSAD